MDGVWQGKAERHKNKAINLQLSPVLPEETRTTGEIKRRETIKKQKKRKKPEAKREIIKIMNLKTNKKKN